MVEATGLSMGAAAGTWHDVTWLDVTWLDVLAKRGNCAYAGRRAGTPRGCRAGR